MTATELTYEDLQIDDMELEFDLEDFDFTDLGEEKNTFLKPLINSKKIFVKYENAKNLLKQINPGIGQEVHCLVKGDFIFGDFIEALHVEKNIRSKNLKISTLGMSQDNVDSLVGLIKDGYTDKLDLVVSNYFYSHEKKGLIPYFIKELGKDLEKIDIMVLRSHTKVTLADFTDAKIVMTGSANLRSAKCIEQFTLTENAEIYQFYSDWFESCKKYSILERGDEL
jgi:hypothetical protein